MEIGEKRTHHPEFVARIDKNVSLAASGLHPVPIARRNIRVSSTVVVPTATMRRPVSRARLIADAASAEIE